MRVLLVRSREEFAELHHHRPPEKPMIAEPVQLDARISGFKNEGPADRTSEASLEFATDCCRFRYGFGVAGAAGAGLGAGLEGAAADVFTG
jgi:hypothetical protein